MLVIAGRLPTATRNIGMCLIYIAVCIGGFIAVGITYAYGGSLGWLWALMVAARGTDTLGGISKEMSDKKNIPEQYPS
jgi:dipeptide/tripeptide permease